MVNGLLLCVVGPHAAYVYVTCVRRILASFAQRSGICGGHCYPTGVVLTYLTFRDYVWHCSIGNADLGFRHDFAVVIRDSLGADVPRNGRLVQAQNDGRRDVVRSMWLQAQ